METEIEKMSLESKDLVAERIDQVKALFPEIITEGEGSIDFEKLRLILGDEVDEGQERYAFTWPGKADAIRQAQIPSTATLRPDKESSVDWDTTENLYIEGDNLEVLKLLQRGYHGKVKMIYIDPPYNTGHDFVYKDSFQDSIENYKEQAGLSGQSNADTSGRYHSDWLSMMYPRLRLARELLSEDGVICVSIDDREMGNLKRMCDEIFGETSFVAQLIWKTKNASKGVPPVKMVTDIHEYILVYERTSGFKFAGIPRTTDDFSNPDNDPRGLWRKEALVSTVSTKAYEIIDPATGNRFNRAWAFSKESMQKMIEEGRVIFPKKPDGTPLQKKFFNDYTNDGTPIVTDLGTYQSRKATSDLMRLFDGNKVFDFPKPVDLIRFLVHQCTDANSLVLDFFSGSGTVLEAVIQQNISDEGERKTILIQMPERLKSIDYLAKLRIDNLAELGEERIRRTGWKIKAEIEEENKQLKLGEEPKKVPDIGFRVLKLDSSSFDKVEGGALVESIVKADRTHEDIIFEMMVKWGLDLSLPMEETEVLGYPITSIAADELICCMDEGLTIDVLEAIAALEPKRVFFLDSVLTDTVKLNAAQIFKRASERMGIEIELRTV